MYKPTPPPLVFYIGCWCATNLEREVNLKCTLVFSFIRKKTQ